MLHIPMVIGTRASSDNSPTLDRIVPELGYIKGNVWVICQLANRIKTNATADQILAVANSLYNRLNKEDYSL